MPKKALKYEWQKKLADQMTKIEEVNSKSNSMNDQISTEWYNRDKKLSNDLDAMASKMEMQNNEWKRYQRGLENEYAGLEAKRMELQKKIEQFKRDEGLYNNQEWLKQSSADSMRVFACATKLAAIYRGIKARREVGPISSPKKGEKGHMRLSNFKDYAVNSADQVDYEPTDSENEEEQPAAGGQGEEEEEKSSAWSSPSQQTPEPIVMGAPAPPVVMAPETPEGSPTVFGASSPTPPDEPPPQSRAEAAKAAARARRAKREEENLLKKAAGKAYEKKEAREAAPPTGGDIGDIDEDEPSATPSSMPFPTPTPPSSDPPNATHQPRPPDSPPPRTASMAEEDFKDHMQHKDAPTEEDTEDGCVFSGWLSKKPQSSNKMLKRRWKARWFRLVEANGQIPCPTIYYYKDDKVKVTDKLGHKVLHDCKVVKIEEKRYQGKFAFDILSPDKPKFCLMATTEEQREQWMSRITASIESYEAGLKREEEADPEEASRHRAQTTAFEQKEEEELSEMADID